MAPAATHRFDRNFTDNVVSSFGPNSTTRAKEVIGTLIRHIHDFARETELSMDEWMLGVRFINSIGQASTDIRNEGQRVSDIIGLETLVDEIANKVTSETGADPTSSSILGPFWSPNAPLRELGDTICQDPHNGQVALMHGQVTDLVTGKGIPGAIVDIWQASANGKYDFQDPENQTPNNLRGKFRCDENGYYHYYCLHPTPYSLPTDGPAGVLLRAMDRHPFRPAHIHLMVTADNYKGCTTQLYPDNDPYLTTDSVFAVKDDLILHFDPKSDDPKCTLDLLYNVMLAPKDIKGALKPSLSTA